MRGALRDTARMAGITLVLLLIFGGIGVALQREDRASAIAPITPHPVDTSQQDLLVDADSLAARMDSDAPPVVIDVSNVQQYALEHIPGAIHLWWQDAMNLNGAGYGEAFSLSASTPYTPALGATQDDAIVVYDNMSNKYASHIVWQLRTSGYPNAMVLDGGLAAWKGAGNEVTDVPTEPEDVPAPTETWLAENEITTPDLSGQFDNPAIVLVDTRNAEQKQDTVNDTIRMGTIPGSISLPAESVMRDDGTFRSPEELADIFADAGIPMDKTIVVYGRFGVESGQVWLALHLAGYSDIRVDDDGWQAWAYDVSLPIDPLTESFPPSES